ncbi:MAG: hypothetical protein PHT91_00200 [Candidatus Nanoarchaeia archaeon]|nr:hypothetical protein [Candidatus Nanoarchaeia archaeon]MDD5054222.1 hypothetical protein [Candidatus Nanoarchaeia archaeon]MDD5499281.1 hypothetical protein [Candidatus Nanoarchaeia archaeon]
MVEYLERILNEEKEVKNFIKTFKKLQDKNPEYAGILGTLFETCSHLNPENADYSSYQIIGGYAVLLTLIKKAQDLQKPGENSQFEDIIYNWRGSHDVDLVSDQERTKNLPLDVFNQAISSNKKLVNAKKYSFEYVGRFKENKKIHGDIYIIPFGKKIKIANAEFERTGQNGGFDSEMVTLFGVKFFIPRISTLIKSKIVELDSGKTIAENYNKIKSEREKDLNDIINLINASDSILKIDDFNDKQIEMLNHIYELGGKSEEIFFKEIYLNNNKRIKWKK